MTKVLAAAVAGAAMMIASCGIAKSQENGGPTVERSFEVGDFERLAVAGPYEVEVRTGSAPSVQARGPQAAIERMRVEVDGDTLEIGSKKRSGLRISWSSSDSVQVTITVPSLKAAAIAGSGDITVDRVTGDSFEGGIAGSGDLRLANVAVNQLKMGISGSGEIRAAGRARNAEYEIAGSGGIEADELVAETAAVSIAGSGSVNGNATGTAAVNIMGSGDVRLRGGAQCTISKAGSGNVTCS